MSLFVFELSSFLLLSLAYLVAYYCLLLERDSMALHQHCWQGVVGRQRECSGDEP